MGAFRSGRDGPSQADLAVRGLVLLSAVAALLGVMVLSMSGTFADTSAVRTRLDTAGGSISPGSDVKVSGLAVGRVGSITGGEEGVELRLDIDDASMGDIPGSVRARILPASVFGTSYVDLVPQPGDTGPSLQAGDVIEQDTSVPTLELQRALDSVDVLVKALGPAELSSALHSLAGMLDGRGEQLGRTIETIDRYLGRIQPEFPLIRENLRLLADNLETISATAPDLLDAVEDALFVADHLVEERAQLTALLTGGLGLIRDSDRFLTDNEEDLVALVRHAAVVTDALYDERAGLRTGLLSIAEVTRKIQTIDGGRWLRVDGIVIDPKYDYYTREDCPRYQGRPGRNCPGGGGG